MNALQKIREVYYRARGLNPEDGLPEGHLGMTFALSAKVLRANGKIEDLGVVSRKSVTTAFVNYLVQSFLQSTTSALDIFKYHDAGTATTAEATGDTTLGTAWGGARATGTNSTGGAANVFQSLATIAFTAAKAITEHGVFSSTTTGTLLDRSSFAVINVASNDSIQFTYQLTCTAGG
jgi:hypothetical protein